MHRHILFIVLALQFWTPGQQLSDEQIKGAIELGQRVRCRSCKDFTANDFRVTRALDSLPISAKAIKGDRVIARKTLPPAYMP